MLVLIVILVFLQDWRAMLVPATTVPVTIIGAFAAMAALGFTVNLSTLFAIVLAIGIVVDDAIVVVEGAAHNIERGMSGHDAAIAAMNALFGPIIGITLVLMAVFLPAAFLPGLTGQMYAQFALVIAATALISAINAVTLKPTQCALWLRRPVPPEQRNFFYRGFNAVYGAMESGYARLIGRMVRAQRGDGVDRARRSSRLPGYGCRASPPASSRSRTRATCSPRVQLPDGASLGRTQEVLDRSPRSPARRRASTRSSTIAGVSALDNNSTLANAGVAYIILKDWSLRGKGEDLLPLYNGLNEALGADRGGALLVLPPPPIQGIGNAAGFTMQIELRDGSFDLAKLQGVVDAVVANAATQSGMQRVLGAVPRRRAAIQRRDRPREGADAAVTVDDVFLTLAGYLGSTYVNQFNKFGRVFQVYVQGDASSA